MKNKSFIEFVICNSLFITDYCDISMCFKKDLSTKNNLSTQCFSIGALILKEQPLII